jgi:DNA-binding transcriptional ArsR family regulator
LSEEERLLLEILKDGEKPSAEVYAAFMAKKKKSKRQVRNYLQLLEAKGLVDAKEVDVGENSFLNTKIYSLKQGGAV